MWWRFVDIGKNLWLEKMEKERKTCFSTSLLLTVQLWQQDPVLHWAHVFSKQVSGSQHGSLTAHS